MSFAPDEETLRIPATVRFPVELTPPPGFRVDEPASWPRVEGRLEYVGGRLLYMPPCGARQQGVATAVALILGQWGERRPGFFVGSNEAGMLLEGDARGADGAVWPRAAVDTSQDRYIPTPPILAVDVGGREEGEAELRAKAAWYLARGVQVVWVVLPRTREVLVLQPHAESRHTRGDTLPAHPALPGLAPPVARFFHQLD